MIEVIKRQSRIRVMDEIRMLAYRSTCVFG